MFWTLVFWLLLLYLTNSALGMIRAVVDYQWYAERVMRRGIEPNLRRLVTTRAITLSFGVLMAFWLSAKAGYH